MVGNEAKQTGADVPRVFLLVRNKDSNWPAAISNTTRKNTFGSYYLLLFMCFGYSKLSGNATNLHLQDIQFESLVFWIIFPSVSRSLQANRSYYSYLLPNICLLAIHDHLLFLFDATLTLQVKQCLSQPKDQSIIFIFPNFCLTSIPLFLCFLVTRFFSLFLFRTDWLNHSVEQPILFFPFPNFLFSL
jgi:hypothetical protein